jgi:hypothetical protein
MLFSDRARLTTYFEGKSVAIVGSGPGSLDNEPGFVDSHDVVVRVNNYKNGPAQGFRTDVFYSFFGGSILKRAEDLQRDGVYLCLAKCPDAKFMESEWHRRHGKENGVDFRSIYRNRAGFWFCPTYVPPLEEFLSVFNLLELHIPTTGFSAVLAVRACKPASLYLTGFDFFASAVHNVNEPWRPGNPNDPIGHTPERERAWLRGITANPTGPVITFDPKLDAIMRTSDAA